MPTHEVGKPYKHKHERKYWHYFMRMDKHPKGWLHLIETPHGMIVHVQKVMPILSSVLVLIGFS